MSLTKIPERPGKSIHEKLSEIRVVWGELNGFESWALNPFVWRLEFDPRRIR